MNHHPALRVFDGTTQPVYLHIFCLNIGLSVRSLLATTRVVVDVLFYPSSTKRTVTAEVYFIFYYFFLSFFLFGFVSPLCACRVIHPAVVEGWRNRAEVSFYRDSMNSRDHYKTEFGTWQHPFLFFFSLLRPVSDHFFFLSKPPIDFCIPFLASAASANSILIRPELHERLHRLNMSAKFLPLNTNNKRTDQTKHQKNVCFFLVANVWLFLRFAIRRVCVFSGRSSPAFSPLTNSHRLGPHDVIDVARLRSFFFFFCFVSPPTGRTHSASLHLCRVFPAG
jgi:hypothetical protein